MGISQVESDTLLVPIHAKKPGADLLTIRAGHERVIEPRPVSSARTLDFDYLGPHIGQNHRAERASNNVRSVQDPQALQRQRQLVILSSHIVSLTDERRRTIDESFVLRPLSF